MSILVAAHFTPDEWAIWWPALQAALPGETLVRDRADAARVEDIDIAIVAQPEPGSLQGLPRLKLIQSLWAGVDRLLADPTLPAGVPLARMVDPAMNQAMAETALWAVLSLHRGFFRYAANQRAGRWQPHRQRRAGEIGVAVLGLGQMGRTVAQRLAANGYRVSGWSRTPAELPGVVCHAGEAALPQVLSAHQVVVNLLPLTPATGGFFNAARLSRLPMGAALINLARGAHVVEDDLLDALSTGRLSQVVLDVFQQEPLPADHPFWQHPHVTVLPHAAAQTDPRTASAVVAANVAAVRSGGAVQHLVQRQRGY